MNLKIGGIKLIVRTKFISTMLLTTLFTMGFAATSTHSTTAEAKASVKIVWRHKVRPAATYQMKGIKSKRSYAYSAKLAHKKFQLAKYAHKQFTVTYQQKVKVHGKYRVYYYAKNIVNHKISGWVWRGYLTKASNKQTNLISKSKLNQLISAAPDLQPDKQVLSLNKDVYSKYATIFNKQYNVGNFAAPGVFFHDHATIYVEDSALQSNVNSAIDKWNAALGADVFSIGSKANSTLTVVFGDGTAAGWDGLFNGTSVQVDQTHFNDQSYVSANTLSPAFQQKIKALSDQASQLLANTNAELKANRENYQTQLQQLNSQLNNATSDSQRDQINQQINDLKNHHHITDQQIRNDYNTQLDQIRQQIKDDYNAEQESTSTSLETNYWTTVVIHELGHALGLYHTPYQSDIMYAPTDNESESTPSPVKYSWTEPKDPDATRSYETAELSSRDINRAKLTKLLGYW